MIEGCRRTGSEEHPRDYGSAFVQGGEIAPNATEAPRPVLRTEATGDFLLEFHHPQVTLGLVIVKGNGKVVDKAEHRNLMSFQSFQEIAGGERRIRPRRFRGSWSGGGRGLAANPWSRMA